MNRSIISILTGSLLVLLAGCKEEEYRLRFSHNLHVEENGMDCSDCHGALGEAFKPISHETCLECHDEPGAEEVSVATCGLCHQEKQLSSLEIQEDYTAQESDGRTIFVHTGELSGKCMDCHGNVMGQELQQVPQLSRADVLRIRNEAHTSGQDCSLCHVGMDPNQLPQSHDQAWMKRHGLFGVQDDASCSTCHAEDSCAQCHSVMQPVSHNNLWRLKSHGAVAAWNRESCSVCHEEDSCTACHSQTKPLSHKGRWAASGVRPTHCISCHNTSSPGDGCSTCHEGGNDVSLHEEFWGGASFDHSTLTAESCYICHWTKTP